MTTSGNTSQPIQWSSEFIDEETKCVNYNYRFYNYTNGRWNGRDKITTHNPYLYANNKFSNIDVLGLYSPQPQWSPASGDECKNREKKMINAITSLADQYSKKPTCNQQQGCELITIFVETGDPCGDIIDYYVGHSGIAVGDVFHDLGPGKDINNGYSSSTRPWWADEDGIDKSKKKLIYAIKKRRKIIKDIPNLVISIEFCVCKSQAEKISAYWNKLNRDMATQNAPKYAFMHPKNQSDDKVLNCTLAVCESLNLDIDGVPYPERFLTSEILSQLHSTCGATVGAKPHISVLKNYFKKRKSNT